MNTLLKHKEDSLLHIKVFRIVFTNMINRLSMSLNKRRLKKRIGKDLKKTSQRKRFLIKTPKKLLKYKILSRKIVIRERGREGTEKS